MNPNRNYVLDSRGNFASFVGRVIIDNRIVFSVDVVEMYSAPSFWNNREVDSRLVRGAAVEILVKVKNHR